MQNERRAGCSLNRNWFMPLIVLAYILSERKGPELHTVSKVWVQHGFVCAHNDAFCFGLYSLSSSCEFLTLDLLF